MSGALGTERILDAFLAPEADRLADRVIEAALADVARTQQRRALRVPWRIPKMPALNRATVVAAVVLVAVVGAGAAFYLTGLRDGGQGGPPTPSPVSSAGTDLLDVTTWTTFTSSRYGFSMKYPATFEAVPSVTFWRMPDAAGNMFDGFRDDGAVKWLNGVSALLSAGATRDDWYDEYRRDLVEDETPWEPETCFTAREDWTSTTIDGIAADLRVSCDGLEAFVFVDGRVYMFGGYGYDGVVPPTVEPGASDELRDMFEAWLTTITLDPTAAVGPTPIPIPSST